MPTDQPFTISAERLFDGTRTVAATHLRVADGVIDAVGGPEVVGPDDVLVTGGTLLPGLIDAHVHLLPGCTRLAATFGVTTVIDQFSKPDVIEPERAAITASEAGTVRCTRTCGRRASAPPPREGIRPWPTPRSPT